MDHSGQKERKGFTETPEDPTVGLLEQGLSQTAYWLWPPTPHTGPQHAVLILIFTEVLSLNAT